MDPKVKKLLDKIRSNINIPLQRENVIESTGTKKPDVVDINLEDKNIYFSDSIDFNKEPTQEEFERYRSYFKSGTPGFTIKESNRLTLAMRYRPFFKEQGVSTSDVMERTYIPESREKKFGPNFGTFEQNVEVKEGGGFLIKQYYPEENTYYTIPSYGNRYTVGYNLGELKNRALSSIFGDEERVERLVDLIDRNTNFDVVSKYDRFNQYMNASGLIVNRGKVNTNLYNVRNQTFEDKIKFESQDYMDQDLYDRVYPEQFNEEGFRKMGIFGDEMDADVKYVDSLMNNRRYETDPTYDYSPRSFKRYNLEEMLNTAYATSSLHAGDSYEFYNRPTVAGVFTGSKIKIGDMMGDTGGGVYINEYPGFVKHGARYPIVGKGEIDLYGIMGHEGVHAANYRGITKNDETITDYDNPAYLMGLDALLGMSIKKEYDSRGMSIYHNRSSEYGAFSIQKALENKEQYERGEDVDFHVFGGSNFQSRNNQQRQSGFYKLLFGY